MVYNNMFISKENGMVHYYEFNKKNIGFIIFLTNRFLMNYKNYKKAKQKRY